MLDSIAQDLKYAWRQLHRAPMFTLIASASLAIGIGVAASALSVMNALFFKPLPVPNPDGIYRVYTSDAMAATSRTADHRIRTIGTFSGAVCLRS
jgi:macrolide transport system ATP-binding/permease protein